MPTSTQTARRVGLQSAAYPGQVLGAALGLSPQAWRRLSIRSVLASMALECQEVPLRTALLTAEKVYPSTDW
jgi:hypothetical protein